MLAEDTTAKGLAPQSVLGQGLFSMQSPKMHSTSWMFPRTQVQGRMNTCEAERALCLSNTQAFSHQSYITWNKGYKGAGAHLSRHTELLHISITDITDIHISATASKGGGDKTPSEPCHTGHGVLVKPRKQEGQRLFPRSQTMALLHMARHRGGGYPTELGGTVKAVTVWWSREGHTYYWGTWPFCLVLYSSCSRCFCSSSSASARRDWERRSGARLALQALCLMKSTLLPSTCTCNERERGTKGSLGIAHGQLPLSTPGKKQNCTTQDSELCDNSQRAATDRQEVWPRFGKAGTKSQA